MELTDRMYKVLQEVDTTVVRDERKWSPREQLDIKYDLVIVLRKAGYIRLNGEIYEPTKKGEQALNGEA